MTSIQTINSLIASLNLYRTLYSKNNNLQHPPPTGSSTPVQGQIHYWRAKRSKKGAGVKLKPSPDERDEKRIHVGVKVKTGERLSSYEQAALLASPYSAVSGSGNNEYILTKDLHVVSLVKTNELQSNLAKKIRG